MFDYDHYVRLLCCKRDNLMNYFLDNRRFHLHLLVILLIFLDESLEPHLQPMYREHLKVAITENASHFVFQDFLITVSELRRASNDVTFTLNHFLYQANPAEDIATLFQNHFFISFDKVEAEAANEMFCVIFFAAPASRSGLLGYRLVLRLMIFITNKIGFSVIAIY